ncbi:MAG TPA: MaoC family dehydratase [Xanthobacteraceae bacterium]|nr:MaoC family dehydratase [Xanthobacteraceae bacterium]
MKYFEDIAIGERALLGSHTFTAGEIKAFAARFDPQPFHLDEALAARSHFGALVASGWHTTAVWVRLAILHRRAEDAARRARGEPVAKVGPSPGFRDLKWLVPVYVGDTIAFAAEVVETRASKSRPGWGLVSALNTGTNQAGALVLSFIGSVMVERRPGG